MCDVTHRRVRAAIVAVEKLLSITYYECVYVALGIQYAKRMLRTILSLVACPSLQHFCTLSHKQHDFEGGGCYWT